MRRLLTLIEEPVYILDFQLGCGVDPFKAGNDFVHGELTLDVVRWVEFAVEEERNVMVGTSFLFEHVGKDRMASVTVNLVEYPTALIWSETHKPVIALLVDVR